MLLKTVGSMDGFLSHASVSRHLFQPIPDLTRNQNLFGTWNLSQTSSLYALSSSMRKSNKTIQPMGPNLGLWEN